MLKKNLTDTEKAIINRTYEVMKKNWRDDYSSNWRIRYTELEIKKIREDGESVD